MPTCLSGVGCPSKPRRAVNQMSLNETSLFEADCYPCDFSKKVRASIQSLAEEGADIIATALKQKLDIPFWTSSIFWVLFLCDPSNKNQGYLS